MSLFPPRSQIDLGGLRLFLKSALNVTVAHGNPISTIDLPPSVDSEIVFTETAPSRSLQIQPTSAGKPVRVKHRILSGGAAGDAAVTLAIVVIDKAGTTASSSMGFTVTPSTQPGFAFDIEQILDVSGFSGDLTDASIIVVLQRTGSGDTLTDPLHLLQSWIEVVNP
jgi:hypothetical protein